LDALAIASQIQAQLLWLQQVAALLSAPELLAIAGR